MKITPKITELLFDLSEIESPENNQYLSGEAADLRNNLLKLYRATDNNQTHATIIAIMTEAGYPWFGKLASVTNQAVRDISSSYAANEEQFMSEEDFLNLLPINGLFH